MVTYLHVGFKVENYERWKQGYDASIEQRKAAGEKRGRRCITILIPQATYTVQGPSFRILCELI